MVDRGDGQSREKKEKGGESEHALKVGWIGEVWGGRKRRKEGRKAKKGRRGEVAGSEVDEDRRGRGLGMWFEGSVGA